MSDLSIDFETRSHVDIRKAGASRYAEDPSTEVLMMAYSFGDPNDVRVWLPGEEFPREIDEHLRDGGTLRAWNAPFEMAVWPKLAGAPVVWPHQWVCTKSEAQAMALPAALEACARVLKLPQQKNADGKRLIRLFSVPRKGKKKLGEDPGSLYFNDAASHPAEWAEFVEYCRQDVRTEMAIARSVNRLLPAEREHWLRVQRKNERGLPLDLELVSALQTIVDEGTRRANAELLEITGGDVTSVTQRDKILRFVNTFAPEELAKLDKHALKEALSKPEIDGMVRRALELRSEVAKASTAKLGAMAEWAMRDGRARGMIVYHGATTGRETAGGPQPHNFARGDDVPEPEQFIGPVLAGQYEALDAIYPPVAIASALLRPCIAAPEGKELIAGDYSAIEARVLNVLAGETRIVDLFRKLDATGSKEFEPYTQNAARFYKIDWSAVKKMPHRQHGKVIELGCGYGCGGPKLREMSRLVYGLELSAEEADDSVKFYRDTHPCVVDWWWELGDAVLKAVKSPGLVVDVTGGIRIAMRGNWLLIKLPTGRFLYYAAPEVHMRLMPWSAPENEIWKPAVQCWAQDNMTRQWTRYDLYGGLLAENIVQAVSRDIMYGGEAQLEKAGYAPILTVHDEIVTEVDEGFGSLEEFDHLMVPQWCREQGWPIAVESWRGRRYRK